MGHERRKRKREERRKEKRKKEGDTVIENIFVSTGYTWIVPPRSKNRKWPGCIKTMSRYELREKPKNERERERVGEEAFPMQSVRT